MSNIEDPWKGLMKILDSKKCTRTQSKTLCSVDGVYAMDLSNTLKLLGDQFYPQPMEYLDVHRNIEEEVERKLLKVEGFVKITECEFRTALKQMSKATAPGADGETNSVLQILAKKCKYERKYIEMFNTCLRIGVFPNVWKQASIVLIPKSYDLLNSMKSLRPISLVSVFSKLLERGVFARILHYIELSGELSLSQHTYRTGGSTTTALYEVVKFTQDALYDKQICMIVFLDISGAFDRTWHGGILHRLL